MSGGPQLYAIAHSIRAFIGPEPVLITRTADTVSSTATSLSPAERTANPCHSAADGDASTLPVPCLLPLARSIAYCIGTRDRCRPPRQIPGPWTKLKPYHPASLLRPERPVGI